MTSDTPNVLLVILDSARARNTSLHGYHRQTTPFLESFAKSATQYTQARAPAGWSLPSHASIFTGDLPQEHNFNSLGTKLDTGASIFEWLSNKGYSTGLFTDNPYLTDLNTGLSNGFDVVLNDKDLFPEGISPAAFAEREGTDRLGFLRAAMKSDKPVESVLNGLAWTVKWRVPWLGKNTVFTRGFSYVKHFTKWRRSTEGPWAACINFMDTHTPFRPADEYDVWTSDDTRAARKRISEDDVDEGEEWKHALRENRYDGTIRQADAAVKKIVDDLRSAGQLDDTLVVVTADHGERFGECDPVTGNAYAGHDDSTPETLLHVPLISKAPGQSNAEVIEDPVGLVDFPYVVRTAVAESMPSFDTGRTVLAGGLMDCDIVDVAYERHESAGVSKYIRAGNDVWTVHAPTPRMEYLVDENVPTNIVEEMSSLSDAEVTHDADTSVSESAQQQLKALGYTE